MTITNIGIPVDADELVERLELVRDELRTLSQSPFSSYSELEAGRAAAGVEGITRAAEALVTACAGGIDRGQSWTTRGFQSFSQWWTLHTHRRRSTGSATRLLARDLVERLPLTAQALTEGRLGGEHAKVMARFTKTESQRQQLLDEEMGEAFLVAQAQKLPVEEFTRVAKSWATRSDPEAADRGWREESAQRELYVAGVLDGTDVRGWLGVEEGRVVAEALRAIIGTPSADDDRTPAQRRADALVHLCRLFLDGGLGQPGSRIRPHIAITLNYDALQRVLNATNPNVTIGELFGRPSAADPGADSGAGSAAENPAEPEDRAACCGGAIIPAALDYGLLTGVEPGTFEDGTPIPYGQLVKLLCDGELHRVIFGPDGQILDSGRTERLFTPAQTRAIIARDRCCQYPGCDAPPGQGEIHHCLWWYHGGRTSTDNGILLCWWHHTLVHQRNLRITRHNHPGRSWWTFTTPDGHPVTTVAPPGDSYATGHRPQPEAPQRE